jgi:tRNA(His) guanylyltransferase
MQDLADRMKEYEEQESGRRLTPPLPALARVDGRSFSRFTADLEGPFDPRLSELMIRTAFWLARETNACAGYTQSDEINLVWLSEREGQQIFFDGRIQKMVSQLAALATAYFNRELPSHLPAVYAERLPTFDARVWNVPTTAEAANCFLWRQRDAVKNSVAMAARHYFSHNQLRNKNGSEMRQMLLAKGVDWDGYPVLFKRGTLIQRRTVSRPFSAEELERLPAKHEARRNPSLQVERTDYVQVEMPDFDRVTNREDVIFRGELPELE